MIRARSLIGAAVTGFRCMSSGATSTCDAARLWGTRDVVKWAEQLGTYGPKIAPLLEKEEVDGPALLELSEADLKEFGLKGGPRKNLLKAIAALTGAPASAVDVPDKLHEPIVLNGEEGALIKVRAEKDFERLTFGGGAVSVWKSGEKVETVTSWADVVTASRDPAVALQLGYGLLTDVSNLKKARHHHDCGLEGLTTAGLAQDEKLLQRYGPLTVLNGGEPVKFFEKLESGKKGKQIMEVDGVLVNTRYIITNECKAALDARHLEGEKGVPARATEFQTLLARDDVISEPPGVLDGYADMTLIATVSAHYVPAAVRKRCMEVGVPLYIPRGSGGGYTSFFPDEGGQAAAVGEPQ